jgi:uncharacterized membrane protein YcaP (DUF421 family)
MDPLRIVFRALIAFITLLALVRASGKRTVKQGTPFDFTIAVILGDMVDDAVWAEVPLSQFVVASSALVAVHVAIDMLRFRSGAH